MPIMQIEDRYTGATLYECEARSLRECLEQAAEARANLYRANLYRADLYRANLSGASLSGANLSGANLDRADLYRADLYRADLSGASLYRANLSGARLDRADLYRADLNGADLSGANLSGARLDGASLNGASGIGPYRSTPLMMLLDQPGPIRMYKLVTALGEGPFNGGITYEIGKACEVAGANTDAHEHCGAGINVATLDWCLREWRDGYRVLVVEFTAADIAAIPAATDGKVRLHRCTVVAEKDVSAIVGQNRATTAQRGAA